MSDNKQSEYYAAKANAWFNTKLEYDKSLLVLSAGAIGLLITLLTTVGVNSITLLLIFITAILSFIVCLISILAIFSRNAKYLVELIQGKDTSDPVLGALDSLSIFSFILGVILSSIIGISIATIDVLSKEIAMTDKKETINKTVDLKESFNGANNLLPKDTDSLSKSFNNANDVAPPAEDNNTSDSTDNTASTQTDTQAQSTDSNSSNKE